jgi:hypothetical protein
VIDRLRADIEIDTTLIVRLVHLHLKYFDIYSPCFNTTLLKPLQIFIKNAFKKNTTVRQSGSEQSLTENKTSCTLFVLYYQPS